MKSDLSKFNTIHKLIKTFFRFKEKSTREWLDIFEDGLCPFGPINNIQQAFNEPQVRLH